MRRRCRPCRSGGSHAAPLTAGSGTGTRSRACRCSGRPTRPGHRVRPGSLDAEASAPRPPPGSRTGRGYACCQEPSLPLAGLLDVVATAPALAGAAAAVGRAELDLPAPPALRPFVVATIAAKADRPVLA